MSEQTAILSLVKMNKRWKILLAAIALAPFVILFIGLLYTRISHFSRSWPEEIKSRGWRVLYSEETSDRFVAICDAGDNKIAVIDTDWDNHLAGGSRLGIYDSENNDIAPGRGEPLNTGVSRPQVTRPHLVGMILDLKVPANGRIRVVLKGTESLASEEYTLLDVEVDWNAQEPAGAR